MTASFNTSFPLLLLLVGTRCSTSERTPTSEADTLVIYNAASLSGPMRALLDTFARRSGTTVQEEHGASLELARRITELQRRPDVIALADHEVFPELLIPASTSWYATFARNRMVVAYTARSRGAAEMRAANWVTVVQRRDVTLGRTDPMLAPAGYRALLTYKLAETFYRQPGLAAALTNKTPPALLRGNAAELAALLAAGELDYIIEYESLARAHNFQFVQLPPAIDLGDAEYATTYASASVRFWNGKDSVTRRGTPILYGVSVPRNAPHAAAGIRFVQFLLSDEGREMLRRGYVDVLEHPVVLGDSAPGIAR